MLMSTQQGKGLLSYLLLRTPCFGSISNCISITIPVQAKIPDSSGNTCRDEGATCHHLHFSLKADTVASGAALSSSTPTSTCGVLVT